LATHGNGIYTANIVKKGDILQAEKIQKESMLSAKLYPNPATRQVKVVGQLNNYEKNVTQKEENSKDYIQVIDPVGRVLMQTAIAAENYLNHNGFEVMLSLENIPQGYYYVRLKVGKALKTLPLFVTSIR
jgi:hypothetical protein